MQRGILLSLAGERRRWPQTIRCEPPTTTPLHLPINQCKGPFSLKPAIYNIHKGPRRTSRSWMCQWPCRKLVSFQLVCDQHACWNTRAQSTVIFDMVELLHLKNSATGGGIPSKAKFTPEHNVFFSHYRQWHRIYLQKPPATFFRTADFTQCDKSLRCEQAL